MKRILYRSYAVVLLLLCFGSIQSVLACPVCYADPESQTSNAVAYAVFALLGVTGTVLGGFVGLFVFLRKRAKKMMLNGNADFPSVN